MRSLSRVAALLLLAAACSSETTAPPPPSIAGTWTLRTISGTPLPFTLQQSGANTLELTAVVYTLTSAPGGSFTLVETFRTTINGLSATQEEDASGQYAFDGKTVVFEFDGIGNLDSGTVKGDTLTIESHDLTFVYVRGGVITLLTRQ